MIISDPVLEPYEIHFDGVQYSPVEKCTSKAGKSYTVTHGYHVDLTFAIKKICELEMSKKDVVTLTEFLSEWKKLMSKFKPLYYEN